MKPRSRCGAVASVEHVFGDSTGNPDADGILRALKATPDGLTRTEISDLFARSRSAKRIEGALTTLLEQARAHFVKEPTNGRPRERWHYGRTSEPSEPKKASLNGAEPPDQLPDEPSVDDLLTADDWDWWDAQVREVQA